ncbi:MAG: potassium channel family protein [bacterium]
MPNPYGFSWWSRQVTPFKRIWISFGVLLLIILLGVSGYMVIEGWSTLDSFYMTIITLSTVGFGEIERLSEAGRVFTMCLIVVGIGTVGYGFGNLAVFLLEGELKHIYRTHKMDKIIKQLHDHIIICGYGHEGRHAGEELERRNVPFLIIEKDAEVAERLREEGKLVLQGDATQDEVMLNAGVAVARGLIASVHDDSDNVFITLTARGLNPHLTIVTRSAYETSVAKLYRAGANKVISSREIGGRRMASVILRPKVVNFLDIIMHDEDLALRLEEIDVKAESPFAGKSIRELSIRERTGALIIALQRPGATIKVNPSADSVLRSGDRLIVMGNESQVQQLCDLASL